MLSHRKPQLSNRICLLTIGPRNNCASRGPSSGTHNSNLTLRTKCKNHNPSAEKSCLRPFVSKPQRAAVVLARERKAPSHNTHTHTCTHRDTQRHTKKHTHTHTHTHTPARTSTHALCHTYCIVECFHLSPLMGSWT